MPLKKIDLTTRQSENVGSGFKLLFIPLAIITGWPYYFRGRLYGDLTFNTALDHYEITLPNLHASLDGSKNNKGNSDTYSYDINSMIPKNELATLQILERISNLRGVVVYTPYNKETGKRLLGAKDIAAYMTYKEDYGNDPSQQNMYKLSIACEMPYPAGFIL